MQATRQHILDLLRRRSHATVKDIGDELGLTATGIRQHLTTLERDGLVQAREERGRVGRPALVYRLTASGDSLYPKKYDELALALIQEARSSLGQQALQQLVRNTAARLAEPYRDKVEGRPTAERVDAIREILQERGNVAEAEASDTEFQVRKQTCPWWNVATRNSVVCALDVQLIRELAGADARLTTSLLRGDDCCTFRIKPN
jgi:predicted ArsR family transcriptional regulator